MDDVSVEGGFSYRFFDRRTLFLTTVAFLCIGLSFYMTNFTVDDRKAEIIYDINDIKLYETATVKVDFSSESLPVKDKDTYTFVNGDTITSVRKRFLLNDSLFYALLEADSDDLALDNIKPGQKLIVSRNEGVIESISLEYNPAKKIVYTKTPQNTFTVKWIHLPGVWKSMCIDGSVKSTFSESSIKSGLTINETHTISQLFKNRIDFNRDFRFGNPFKVLVSRHFVDGKPTGESKILAIQIYTNKRNFEAFLFNGHYYDKNAVSIEQAFDSFPFNGNYKISSHFNPKRKHPVTGEIKPHYGTDYAMPVGTTVNSTANGIVTRVVRHRYAGLYIEIDHSSQYQTRYLHLSKVLVKKGQSVSRGMPIALSGKSGRVTAAHLHYEFHSGGRPVDAVKSVGSRSFSLSDKDKSNFSKKMADFKKQLAVKKA